MRTKGKKKIWESKCYKHFFLNFPFNLLNFDQLKQERKARQREREKQPQTDQTEEKKTPVWDEAYIQSVKNIILRLFVLHEKLQVLEDTLLHRNRVGVADGVFTQEIKVHHKLLAILLLMQGQVLNAQRAAAHSVRSLTLFFLISRSQGKLLKQAVTC